jgi:molecular chaperone GrpE
MSQRDDNPFVEQDLEEVQPPSPDGQPADPTAALEADLRKLQDERDRVFDQLARVTADFRNAQKRLEADKQQAIQFANTNLVKGLLPILDNFERALEVDPAKTDVATLLKGMQIVHDQLVRALAGQQVQVIAPEPGTPFDPKLHEALMQQPSDKYKEPTVTQLLQKGYGLHDRVLRPAQVAVSKPA